MPQRTQASLSELAWTSFRASAARDGDFELPRERLGDDGDSLEFGGANFKAPAMAEMSLRLPFGDTLRPCHLAA